jgi:hypothetical protein
VSSWYDSRMPAKQWNIGARPATNFEMLSSSLETRGKWGIPSSIIDWFE